MTNFTPQDAESLREAAAWITDHPYSRGSSNPATELAISILAILDLVDALAKVAREAAKWQRGEICSLGSVLNDLYQSPHAEWLKR